MASQAERHSLASRIPRSRVMLTYKLTHSGRWSPAARSSASTSRRCPLGVHQLSLLEYRVDCRVGSKRGMDPVGFGVGVIGLAGLTTTCVDAFNIFRGMRAFGRDAEILVTKLDIEKNLLLQWAIRVGLFNKDLNLVDCRLFDQRTDHVVSQTLKEINILLRDSSELERKYGLRQVPASAADLRTDLVSKHRMRRLDPLTSPTHSPGGRGETKRVGLIRKLVWAIHSKDEFDELIDKLEYFIGKLNEMIPTVEKRRMMCEDLRAIGADAHTLRLIEAATNGVHDEWSETASQLADETEAASEMNIGHRKPLDSRKEHHDRPSRRLQDPSFHQKRRSAVRNMTNMFDDVVGRSSYPRSSLRR